MTRPRVFFYVQHLLGIGHLRRAAAITRALERHGLTVAFVAGGEPVPGLDLGGADVIQLPPARAGDSGFGSIVDDAGRPIDDAWRERRRASAAGRIRTLCAGSRADRALSFRAPALSLRTAAAARCGRGTTTTADNPLFRPRYPRQQKRSAADRRDRRYHPPSLRSGARAWRSPADRIRRHLCGRRRDRRPVALHRLCRRRIRRRPATAGRGGRDPGVGRRRRGRRPSSAGSHRCAPVDARGRPTLAADRRPQSARAGLSSLGGERAARTSRSNAFAPISRRCCGIAVCRYRRPATTRSWNCWRPARARSSFPLPRAARRSSPCGRGCWPIAASSRSSTPETLTPESLAAGIDAADRGARPIVSFNMSGADGTARAIIDAIERQKHEWVGRACR